MEDSSPPPSYHPTTDRSSSAQSTFLAANIGADTARNALSPAQHAQPGRRERVKAANDDQPPGDDLAGFGLALWASLRDADGITVTLYAFALAVAVFSVAVEAVGDAAPAILCKKTPGLVLYYNTLDTTCMTALPGLLLNLGLAAIGYTDEGGVTHTIRAYFERPSRRYGVVFFSFAFTLIAGSWGYHRADTTLINCADYQTGNST